MRRNGHVVTCETFLTRKGPRVIRVARGKLPRATATPAHYERPLRSSMPILGPIASEVVHDLRRVPLRFPSRYWGDDR